MPFSSTIVLPALELPVNCSIDLRTSSRSSGVANDLSYLMKPPADRPEPNILPLAWSVAMERPIVWRAIAIGDRPTRPSTPKPLMCSTSSATNSWRWLMPGKRLGNRADAKDRGPVGLGVGALGAPPEAVDRGLAVLRHPNDERGNLEREEQDLPGEADRLVEQRRFRPRLERPGQRRAGEESERLAPAHEALRRAPQPMISLPENHCAISCSAVCGASEPCTEFSPMDRAKSLRIVPASAFFGSVAPMTVR